MRRTKVALGGVSALVATLVASVILPAPGAARGVATPLVLATSSLAQSGRDLVWSVTAATPFSPAALVAGGRSLCLTLTASHGGGRLCVAGPAPGRRAPRLVWSAAGAAPDRASTVSAIVTRADRRSLTAAVLPTALGLSYTRLRWQAVSTAGQAGCPPAAACAPAAVYPAAPARLDLHTPRLAGCTAIGPDMVFNRPAAGHEIALTFDDGPWYQTPQFVALLARYRVPATFFQIGRQIVAFGEGGALDRRMLADGDMIGDHTWSHADVAGAGPVARDQIERAAAAIRQATGGFGPCLFRAPYGDVSGALETEARTLGLTTIGWNIDPRDWATPGVAEIESNVLANARPGAIVELHDGGGNRSQTLAALPDIITTLRARGYQFVTVTQLLGQDLVWR